MSNRCDPGVRLALAIGLTILSIARSASSQDAAKPAVATPPALPAVEVVVANLEFPWTVAVQPETNVPFVAEGGAGRVVRVQNGKPEVAIVDFPTAAFPAAPEVQTGPLGLAFFDKDHLFVGEGGGAAGADRVRLFTLPAAGQPAVKFAEHKSPLKASSTFPPNGGKFFRLAASKWAVFGTYEGDEATGAIARALAGGTDWSEWKPFVPAHEILGSPPTGALAIAPEGEVVVAQRGPLDGNRDGVLAFFNANSGKLLLHQPLSLMDVVGLAYSPKSGQLYAVDMAWSQPAEAGLYRVSSERSGGQLRVVTQRVAKLERPTSLAFASDGTLYVTTLGAAKSGQLLKIAPGL